MSCLTFRIMSYSLSVSRRSFTDSWSVCFSHYRFLYKLNHLYFYHCFMDQSIVSLVESILFSVWYPYLITSIISLTLVRMCGHVALTWHSYVFLNNNYRVCFMVIFIRRCFDFMSCLISAILRIVRFVCGKQRTNVFFALR